MKGINLAMERSRWIARTSGGSSIHIMNDGYKESSYARVVG